MATDLTLPGTAAISAAGFRAAETAAAPGIAILFALEREAAPFRRAAHTLANVSIQVTGVGRKRARAATEHILSEWPQPSLVIAAGFCGALSPHLRVGDVVTSRILTVDHLVSGPSEKRRLGQLHDAVDMESAAIGDVCAAKGVAYRAVRAVSDTVDTALSPELVQLLAGGNVSVWKAMKALIRRPGLLGEFRRLARDTKLAAQNLAKELMNLLGEPRPQGSGSR